MKRISILLSLCVFFNMFSAITFAADSLTESDIIDAFCEQQTSGLITEQEEIEAEQKLYSEATVNDSFVNGEVLVVLSKEQSALQQEYTVSDFPFVDLSNVVTIYDYYPEDENNIILKLVLNSDEKEKVIEAITALEADNRVISAEPNYIMTIADDEKNFEADNMNARSSSGLYYERYSDLYTYACCARKYTDPTKNTTVKVGIMDTGVYNNIPELGYIEGGTTSGYKVKEYVYCRNDRNENSDTDTYSIGYVTPESYHGTNVALALAKNLETTYYACPNCGNNVYAGTCINVDLYSLTVCSDFDKTPIGYIVNGFNYCRQTNINILNISFDLIFEVSSNESGTPENRTNWKNTWIQAINNYPGIIITAAGNDMENLDLRDDEEIRFPIENSLNNVIVVGNCDVSPTGVATIQEDSNFGVNTVDLFAPGKLFSYKLHNNTVMKGYDNATSYSAPRVAGAAAVLLNIKEDLTPAQIKRYIMAGVDESSNLYGKCVSGGSLNIYKSAKLLIADMAFAGKAVFAGKFTDDENMQVAAMTDGGNGMMKVYVWTYENGEFSDPEHWRTINQFYMSTAMYKNICGDFDGNGYDEIATFYTWSDSTTEHKYIFVTGNGYAKRVGDTPFSASVFEGKVAAMNCDSDAADEIVGLCDITNGSTDVYVWNFTGQQGSMSATYSTSPYRITRYFDSDNIKYKVAAGNFIGDGRQEFAALYRATGDVNRYYLIMLEFTDSGIAYSELMDVQNTFNVNTFWGRIVTCNYDGLGHDEIVFMFDNANRPEGSAYTISNYVIKNTADGWECEIITDENNDVISSYYYAYYSTDLMTSADFTGDGKDDYVAFYIDTLHGISDPYPEINLFIAPYYYPQVIVWSPKA